LAGAMNELCAELPTWQYREMCRYSRAAHPNLNMNSSLS
jgi:hypothetical protein